MISVGLDIGYSSTKAVYDGGKFRMPSIVGTYEDWFSVNKEKNVFEIDGNKYLVGQEAIEQSQIFERREDRGWIQSEMYERLLKYSLISVAQKFNKFVGEIFVVSGLPLSYFTKDAPLLKKIIIGEYSGSIGGVENYFSVKDAVIIPQPFGSLLDYALNSDGGIISERASGKNGVIDIGGKTTNILSVNDLAEQSREATSVSVGGWTAVRKLQDYLSIKFPEVDDMASNVEKILVDKSFIYFGEKIDITGVVKEITQSIADQIKAEISQRWGSAAQFERILISGGGAYLIGESITDVLGQAFVVDDPVYSNAKGFYKFAKRRS